MRAFLRDEELPLAIGALLALGLAVLGLVGGSGCGVGRNGSGASLLSEVNAFNNAVRWDRREEAADRIPVAKRNAFLDRLDEIEDDVRIDDWELDRADLNTRAGTATVRLHFYWHRVREALLRKTLVEEHWKKRGAAWLLTGLKTRSGEPVPAFQPPEMSQR